MKSFALVLSFCFLTAACSTIQFWKKPEAEVQQEESAAKEKSFIQEAQNLLKEQKFDLALKHFSEFLGQYTVSSYTQSARMGLAQSYEGLGKWDDASKIFRDVVKSTDKNQPEISAEALYQLSYCYEAMGEDEKAVAALLDALNRKSYLKPELALAVVPSRLSSIYFRTDQPKLGEKYLKQVDVGIPELKRIKQKDDPAWLAELYYNMGHISLNQISNENYGRSIKALKRSQGFLQRALELNDPTWSKASRDFLKNIYRDLWNNIQQSEFDESFSDADKTKIRREQVGLLLEAIEDLHNKQMDSSEGANEYEKAANEYIASLEKLGEEYLYQAFEINPLTPEAEQLQGLKVKGKIYDHGGEPTASEKPAEKAKDPNL